MSSKIDTLFGFSDVCTGCGKLCTIQITRPKNTYIYLPVINHKIVYEYMARTPDSKTHTPINTICFNPRDAFEMGLIIVDKCTIYKKLKNR